MKLLVFILKIFYLLKNCFLNFKRLLILYDFLDTNQFNLGRKRLFVYELIIYMLIKMIIKSNKLNMYKV